MSKPIIFIADDNQDFGQLLAKRLGWLIGRFYQQIFSEGNLFVRLDTPVTDCPVVIVQSLSGPQLATQLWRLLFLLDAAKRAGSTQQIVVIPFFSYGKADRADESGCSLRSQVIADCLRVAGATAFITLDWHQSSLKDLFAIPTYNLDPTPLWVQHYKKNNDLSPVVVAPDAGAKTRAQALAAQLACPVIIGCKNRPDYQEKPQLRLPTYDWRQHLAIIVDDFTTSGGTLIACAKQLHQAGCRHIEAYVSHAPLTPRASNSLNKTPIKRLITTNTTAIATKDKLEVLDASGIFAKQLRQMLG